MPNCRQLSFILPCYNVGRYVSECLDSIYAIDMPETDFEVICVNDASTDNTRDVILGYQAKHSNLRLLDHECNKYSGAARNAGIEVAMGEYVWFVDADDKIIPSVVAGLYGYVKENALDIVMFNFENFIDKESMKYGTEHQFVTSDVLSGQEYVSMYFNNSLRYLSIVWRCWYKRAFLEKCHVRYPLILRSQDAVFAYECMIDAERVASVDWFCYRYRINEYTGLQLKNNARYVFSISVDFGLSLHELLLRVGDRCTEAIRKCLEQSVAWAMSSYAPLYIDLDAGQQRLFRRMMRECRSGAVGMKCLKLKYKMPFALSNCEMLFSFYCRRFLVLSTNRELSK